MSGGISLGTVAAVSAATAVAGTAVSAIGSIQQGQAAAASDRYNAQVAQENQTLAQQNATSAAQAGEVQAAQQEQKTRATVGAIKAAQAASGIDVNSGSALDVQSSEDELGATDAINIRANAAKQAYGFQTQGVGFENSATLDQSSAGNAETAGEMGAGSSLLSGLGSAAGNYNKFLTQNGFTGGTSFGVNSDDPFAGNTM